MRWAVSRSHSSLTGSLTTVAGIYFTIHPDTWPIPTLGRVPGATSDRNRTMKVIFFGAYDINARIPLVAELRNRGIDVELAGIGATPTAADSTAHGTITHAVGSGNLKRDIAKIPGLVRQLRLERGADLIHSWDSLPGALAMQAAKNDADGLYTRTITGTGQSFSTTGAKGFALRSAYGTAQRLNADEADFTIFQNTDDHKLFLHKG